MIVSFDLSNPFDSSGEIAPSWANLKYRRRKTPSTGIHKPEVYLLVMVEVRDDMPALNISCNIIGSMISQQSFLLLLTSSH